MDPPESLPWYRYFWPWFIVVLMGSAVLASVATVLIAYGDREPLVREDWYEKGASINQRLHREREAKRLGVEATLWFAEPVGELRLQLRSETIEPPQSLRLELSHPARSEQDRGFVLTRTPAGDFRAELNQPLAGRWYATLWPVKANAASDTVGSWQISQLVTLPAPEGLRLGAER